MGIFYRLPRLLLTLPLVAALIYAEQSDSWTSLAIVLAAIGVIWLGRACFPLFFRLDQKLRRQSRDQSSDDGQ